jgi:hypothetical protein
MGKNVIVITGSYLGWDCVVGVFDSTQAILDSWLNQECDEPYDSWSEFKADQLDGEFHVHYEQVNT